MAGKNKWLLLIFCLAHAIILPVIFNTFYKTPFSSIALYFNYASWTLSGSLPYRDFTLEYPPFSLIFFILPRLFFSNFNVYAIAYQVEVYLFDILGLYLIYRMANWQGKAPWKMLAVYSVAILAIGPIVAVSYDIFPAILTLLSLFFFWAGKHKLSWVFLALGVMVKIYPVFVAPVYLLYYLKNKDYRHIWSGILTFGIANLVIIAPFLITSPKSLFILINYHGERGIQLETIYSVIILIGGKLGMGNPQLGFDFGSWNFTGPLSANLAKASTFITVIVLLVAYWFIYRRTDKTKFFDLGGYFLLVIGIVLITSKVLSPQYLIWLVSLLPLAGDRRLLLTGVLFTIIGLLTFYIFPLHYVELINQDSMEVFVLLLRNLLLVLITILFSLSLSKSKSGTVKIEN